MSGLEWTPDVSIYRQPWRENTGACLQAPAGEGITMTSMWSSASGDYGMTSMEADPEVIRAEIIRLSCRLPKDDPLRIAIACAPYGPPLRSQGD